jgi:glucosamine-6-phosphate deaminase
MGFAAAAYVTDHLQRILALKSSARIVVGSAPAQDEFFHHLVGISNERSIDWSRVEVFHMDEYIGLSEEHPRSFRRYQMEHFIGKVGIGSFHGIRGEATDPEGECDRLENLLGETPIDLVCCGIGENGHLAFNDPPVADFKDPRLVKIVEMDDICRQQQVNDGCFPSMDAVPTHAITFTLRVFVEARILSCVVPAETKAQAVADTLHAPISTACPATLMRQHPDARLFLEPDSATLL